MKDVCVGRVGYLTYNDSETPTWYVYNLYVPIIKVVEMQRFIRVIIGRYVSSRKFQKSYSTFRIDQFTTSSKSFRLKGNQDSSTIGRWLQHIREGTHWNNVIYMCIFKFLKCLLIQNKGRRIFFRKKNCIAVALEVKTIRNSNCTCDVKHSFHCSCPGIILFKNHHPASYSILIIIQCDHHVISTKLHIRGIKIAHHLVVYYPRGFNIGNIDGTKFWSSCKIQLGSNESSIYLEFGKNFVFIK